MKISGDVLRELFAHMRWADVEIWRAVLATPASGDDAALKGLLCHIHNVQHAFLDVWRQRPLGFREPGAFADLTDLQAWSSLYYPEAEAFLSAVADDDLARPVVMPWAGELANQLGREPGAPTLGETMFQITSHSTYHRGQVNARLRALGGEPPLVDYIAWIWFGRPSPRNS
jgi:uncharacterized damage-inducible protein DinB